MFPRDRVEFLHCQMFPGDLLMDLVHSLSHLFRNNYYDRGIRLFYSCYNKLCYCFHFLLETKLKQLIVGKQVYEKREP